MWEIQSHCFLKYEGCPNNTANFYQNEFQVDMKIFLTTTVHGNDWRLHTVATILPRSEVTVIVPLEPLWDPRPLDGSTKLTALYLYIQLRRKNINIRSCTTGGSKLTAV
jgi:hypothetical protein